MAPRESPWTDALIQRLKELTALGRTANQAAKELTLEFHYPFSRNAIIGKQNRMGFARPNDVTGRPKIRPRPKLLKPARKHRLASVLRYNGRRERPTFYVVSRKVEVLNISFEHLQDNQCHWPCEGRDEWGALRCGHPVVFGTKWCPGHARIVYNVENRHEYLGAGSIKRQLPQAYTDKDQADKSSNIP